MPSARSTRRALLGITDQGVYSLTNFLLTVLVARAAEPAAFGAFALALATYLVTSVVVRGLTSETLLVRFSDVDVETWRAGTQAGLGVSVAAGLVVAGGFGVTAACTGGAVTTAFGTFAVLMPGLFAQDFLRYAALAAARPSIAVVNDVTVAAFQVGVSVAVLLTGRGSMVTFLAAWGAGAYVGAAVGIVLLGVVPLPGRTVDWFRRHGELAVRYGVDDLANQGSQQANSYAVALFGNLTETAALRAGITVFGPLTIANLGVMAAVTPELVRVLRRSPARMRRLTDVVGLALAAVNLVWGVAALLLPTRLGRELFGATWPLAHPLILFLSIAQLAAGLRVSSMAGLRALADPRRTLRARWVTTVLGLVTTVAGAAWDGAHGVVVALAVVTPVQALVWRRQFALAYADHVGRTGRHARPERPDPAAADARPPSA